MRSNALMLTLIYRLALLLGWTCRFKIINSETWQSGRSKGESILFCIWHQQILVLFYHFIKLTYEAPPFIMVSQSKDGDLAARMVKKTGWTAVRGSSSRGARAALRACYKKMKASDLGVHVLDGPRGPRGVVKPGVVFLARLTKSNIVPAYAEIDRAWFLKSWDRFCIPKPFASITIHFGDPITPQDLDKTKDMEEIRLGLQNRMQGGLL